MLKKPFTLTILLFFSILSLISQAADLDNDKSPDTEEVLAHTSDNDPTRRPYWKQTMNGNGVDDQFGAAVSAIGDVNGDGYNDFAIGAPRDDDNWDDSGTVQVRSGRYGNYLYQLVGDPADLFGFSIAAVGDVNGDTYDDFLVGSPGHTTTVAAAGKVALLSGADGAQIYSYTGEVKYDNFGYAVVGIGDVTGDAVPDFAAGAPGSSNPPHTGFVRVFNGATGAEVYRLDGANNADWFGSALSPLGDVNSDGYPDFIIGARYTDAGGANSGSVHVVSGVDGTEIYRFDGEAHFYWSEFGASVSAADVNADGYQDIIAGTGVSSAGYVKVYSGKTGEQLYRLADDGEGYESPIGEGYDSSVAVAGLGDVNGDGYEDFAIGFHDYDDSTGFADIYSGFDASRLYRLRGDDPGDRFGASITGLGDNNGDGYPEFLVGASYDDNNGKENSGSVRRFLSKDLLNDVDTDNILNAFDLDNDNDGFSDIDEVACGSGAFDETDFCAVNYSVGGNDFDRDADDDVLIRSSASGNWQVYTLQSAALDSNNIYAAYNGSDWQHVANLDVDADGDVDVLLRNSVTGKWHVAITQSGAVSSIYSLSIYNQPNYQFQAALDADADGDSDILIRDSINGQWTIFLMQSGAVQSSSGLALFSESNFVFAASGDFDGDIDDDILLRNTVTGKYKKFDMDAASVTVSSGLRALYASSDWQLQMCGDMDADGKDDLLFRNTVTGRFRVFIINNNVITAESPLSLFSSSDYVFQAGVDGDADGDVDLLTRKSSNGNWLLFSIEAGIVQSSVPLGLPAAGVWQLAQ
ncbi:MAG: FG-GAP repeat protein [Pseudomonadales bacterium]|nr:FG-GAP repeat protein [Pseudomonadales bacterium]